MGPSAVRHSTAESAYEAAALGAEWCEICSDVDGIYSADPRVVPAAKRISTLSHEETQELAEAYAKRSGIEYRVIAPKDPVRQVVAYPDNFRYTRTQPWTH